MTRHFEKDEWMVEPSITEPRLMIVGIWMSSCENLHLHVDESFKSQALSRIILRNVTRFHAT